MLLGPKDGRKLIVLAQRAFWMVSLTILATVFEIDRPDFWLPPARYFRPNSGSGAPSVGSWFSAF